MQVLTDGLVVTAPLALASAVGANNTVAIVLGTGIITLFYTSVRLAGILRCFLSAFLMSSHALV